MYSYHIFYFPFKWEIADKHCKSFSEQTDLNSIKFEKYSNWVYNPDPLNNKEWDELYNEKNYYYQFVHPVLYDTGKEESIIKHFERKEPQETEVFYKIAKKEGKTYILKVDAITLNLYTTGVGMLSFFLKNEKEDQKEPDDILNINQYGRRIFPPFIGDLESRYEIAEYLAIEGLTGNPNNYKEDFSQYNNKQYWHPSCFIQNLITDLTSSLKVEPVIDDRMFVNCWYGNEELSQYIKNKTQINTEDPVINFEKEDDFWYKYVFVDVNYISCQDNELRKKLIKYQTYTRWQGYGTLYGMSRYSFVSLSDESDYSKKILTAVHMRTIYARMIELVIIQRASILKFSNEVTRVSRLTDKYSNMQLEQIRSLYKEYIRFVNQIYFREITTQDQGIELYDLMSSTLKTEEYIEDLDQEIEELHRYASMMDDWKRGKNAEKLSIIAAIFLPATLIAGIFGMNGRSILNDKWFNIQTFIIAIVFIVIILYQKIKKIRHGK